MNLPRFFQFTGAGSEPRSVPDHYTGQPRAVQQVQGSEEGRGYGFRNEAPKGDADMPPPAPQPLRSSGAPGV